MPLLIDTESRVATLVRAVNDVLLEAGPRGLTMRRIAEAARVSTSSILHHLGSRDQLIRVAAGRTCSSRTTALRAAMASEGALAFLPRNDEELLQTRAWLAWLELWRCEDIIERWIATARGDEVALLARVCDSLPGRPDAYSSRALIDGLRISVCEPRRPLGLDEARRMLATSLGVPFTAVPEEIRHPWWAGSAP